MITLTFEMKFTSNYHVGAGYGRGVGMDSALLREADGRPVLRGTAVAGLLRDGARRLLKILPDAEEARSRVEKVFGTPEQEKTWRVSSAELVSAPGRTSSIRWRVRIDPRSRRAEPNKLFSQEEGAEGAKFQFSLTCVRGGEAALDEAALLTALARMVREAGRSRRRGVGECVIHLVGVTGAEADKAPDESWEDWLLARFERVWLRGGPRDDQGLPMISKPDFLETEGQKESPPVRLRVVLHLDEPLLVAQRSAAGNRYDSQKHIPGTVLLGALATLAAQCHGGHDPEMGREFVDLFLRGGLRCSALYLAEYQDGFLHPAFPAPFALLTCSLSPLRQNDNGHGIFPAWDRGQQKCPKCGSRLEQIRSYMVFDPSIRMINPRLSTEMHIRVDPTTQRAAAGNLYSYRVLASGQYFLGEMELKDEISWLVFQAWTGIREKHTFSLWLGKGRRKGYGKVTGWLERVDGQPPWMLGPLEERVKDPAAPLSMVLVSDAVVPNDWGQQAGISEPWLAKELGVDRVTILDVYGRSKWVDGFNAVLGLPRWRDTALAAGTTVLFRFSDPQADWADRLQKVEWEGIGLRRHEGFGRVVFNHPVFEDCRNMETFIPLQEDMIGDFAQEDWGFFVKQWEKETEEKLENLTRLPEEPEGRLVGLSRWLYAHRHEPPVSLAARLREMGQPDAELVAFLGGIEEGGERVKTNRFQQECEHDVALIADLLQNLDNMAKDGVQQSQGIEIVASRLAARAGGRAREERGAR